MAVYRIRPSKPASGLGLVVALLLAGCADPPGRPRGRARYVEGGVKQPQLGDLAGVLHVTQMRGKAQLNTGYRSVTLALTAYKDGKPVDLPDSEALLLNSHETRGTIEYAVDVVDLDFLPLGGGKKGHCRLRASFAWPDGSTGWAERDIPKGVIDLAGSTGKMAFTEAASAGREVPLVWFVGGRTVPLTAETREQVLARAKEGPLLFVALRFDDPPAGRK